MNLKIIGILQREIDKQEETDKEILEMITELKNAFIQIQNDLQRIDNVLNGLKGKQK
jgi:hypothetical protein